MLQTIISPAKTMRIDTDSAAVEGIPPFPEKTKALLGRLHGMGCNELQALWKTSDRLTEENIARLRDLAVPETVAEANAPQLAAHLTPALFAYDGIQYTSLAPQALDESALGWLQAHLWILSGFYGCARPFDGVMPYRLEMGAALEIPADAARPNARNLYEFWGQDIARTICDDGTTFVVNLASVEYARAVLPQLKGIGSPVRSVTCIFGEFLRNDKPVQRATASKTARGSMLRWMAENRVEDPAELARFNVGYTHMPALSHEDGHGNETLVFMKD